MGALPLPLPRARSYTVNLRLPVPQTQNSSTPILPAPPAAASAAAIPRPALTSLSSLLSISQTSTSRKLVRPTVHKRTMSAAVHSTSDPFTMASDAHHDHHHHHHHHNRDFALQKYLLLQEQHESLQQHLDQIRPPASPPASPTHRSPSVSSTSSSRHHQRAVSRRHSRSSAGSSQQQQQHSYQQYRHNSAQPFGLETVPDETTLHEVAVEEARLFDVNEGIKRALTELLNCEAVRADGTLRTWVQGRLLETERELRTSRRRRSAPGAAEHY